MGHHSAAYTLETYGHLIDDDLGSALQHVPARQWYLYAHASILAHASV
jgi:hypothetical protein